MKSRTYGLGVYTDLSVYGAQELRKKLTRATQEVVLPYPKNDLAELAYVHVSEQVRVLIKEKNEQHTFLLDKTSKPCSFITINVGKGCSGTVVLHSTGEGRFGSSVVRVVLEERAALAVYALHDAAVSLFYAEQESRLEERAVLGWTDIVLSGSTVISETTTTLAGNSARAEQHACFLAKDAQYDIASTVIHERADTKSNVAIKGVCFSGSALFRGLIKILPAATGSDGYQKSDILLLSQQAKANVIPTLEIQNADVKCSHGATIAPHNPEKLFYLMSRGLSKSEALQLLLTGFFEPLTQTFPESIKNLLQERVAREAEHA
ncbi:MAG: SufD family Fe-S cluster assembly protein [archaeon]